MKLSTLLLTTTALVVAGSAYAADLPAKKGAPAAKAATGCPAFGAGYFQIPGGDTCIKIGGYVRSNNTYTTDTTARGTAPYTMSGAYGLSFDVKNNSDIGVIASQILIENTATTYAFVQAGGFTAGQFDDLTDIYSAGINGGNKAGLTGNGILYSIPAGASTVSLGVVKAPVSGNATTAGRPDIQLGLKTAMGPASLNVVAVSHEANGATSGSASGWAVVGSAGVTAGVASVSVYGGTAAGASAYITSYTATTLLDASGTSGELSSSNIVGAKASMALGSGTVAVYGNSINASGASGSTTSYKSTTAGLQYALPVAKGLTVTPEVYNLTTNIGSGNTSSNNIYLRIHRDF